MKARPGGLPLRRCPPARWWAFAIGVASSALLVALACEPRAQAAAPDRGEWLVGARAGALLPEPFSPLAATFLAGVELGWVMPVWKHRLAVVADVSLGAPEANGSAVSAAVGGAYSWHLKLHEIGFGLSVFYRHRIGRVTPYLGVGPRLVVLDGVVEGAASGHAFPPARETSAHLGVGLVPGVGLAIGPGQVFVELPLVLVAAVERTTGAFSASSLAFALGYRVLF